MTAAAYGEIAKSVLETTEAAGVIVIVIDGKYGPGLALAARPEAALWIHDEVPGLMRAAADEVATGGGGERVSLYLEERRPPR